MKHSDHFHTPRRLIRALWAASSLALAFATGGCASDRETADEPAATESAPAAVNFRISARPGALTRADGTPSEPSAGEMINSWWLAFVDGKGTVRQIVARSATGAVEAETFKCPVPAGVYSIYAFANITTSMLAEATGMAFAVGEKMELPAGAAGADDILWSKSLNGWTASTGIPMTGMLKNVRIHNTVEEIFSIEVVRMVAKMELQFSNSSGEDVLVKSVSVDPVTLSAVSLFPLGPSGISYDHLGESAYTPADDPDAASGLYSHTLATPLNVTPGADGKKSLTFYIQESTSGRDNDGAFTVGLTTSHDGGITDWQQYNITRDILSYINRNDHIVIPIDISRYAVDVEGVGYPPIGGYPAVTSSADPEGAQIFTFVLPGDFALVSHVMDKAEGRHLGASYYSVSVSDIEDPDGIFTLAGTPAVAGGTPALPQEICGEFSSAKGKATLSVTVNIYDRPRYESGAKSLAVYSRKIHLVRAD